MFQYWINAESFPVSQLCVNTLSATKITLITDGIELGSLRVKLTHIIQFAQSRPNRLRNVRNVRNVSVSAVHISLSACCSRPYWGVADS
jgi:hypothetical protein